MVLTFEAVSQAAGIECHHVPSRHWQRRLHAAWFPTRVRLLILGLKGC